MISRRNMLSIAASSTAIAALPSDAAALAKRRFTIDLRPGSIGVKANQLEAIALAAKHRFESVGANAGELAAMNDDGMDRVVDQMKTNGLVWGSAGLPVEFRKTEDRFQKDLGLLPQRAAALQRVGVKRVGTWIRPGSDELTYRENFQLHRTRLSKVARILHEHQIRFGLEYVGTPSLRFGMKFTFIHSLRETRELLDAIDAPNTGLVLDSWHWYTAAESVEDLRSLNNEDVIACDLNDAPAGRTIGQQLDNQRELPLATGVIDVKAFLDVLLGIGYDGPVRAEPFNQALNQLENDEACAKTSESLHAAIALLQESG